MRFIIIYKYNKYLVYIKCQIKRMIAKVYLH